MSAFFCELDWQPTPIGPISLRRRRELRLGVDVYEVRLGDEFLMSSLFTASEEALAALALARLPDQRLDVLVGGLGLGHTAAAVLGDPRTATCTVVEFLRPVIDWHRAGLVPLARTLTDDPRCRIVEADFFARAASPDGIDPEAPGRRYDAVLVDIDHSPEALLDDRSAAFYRPEGLARIARHLAPGGVFGLWSDAQPDPAFVDRLAAVFRAAAAEPVTFDSPLLERPYTQTVYLGQAAPGDPS